MQLIDPYRGWVILLVGIGGAWLISTLWIRSLARGLRLRREMRFGWAQVGDQLEERLTLENNGWAPATWVEIVDHSTLPGHTISQVTGISGMSSNQWHTQGRCTRRGLFSLGPTGLRCSDPFGIYTLEVTDSATRTLMVMPPVVPLPAIEVAPGGRSGEGRPRQNAPERTVSSSSVREYMPGDSLRWIHWRTTARRNKPFVRIFDGTPAGDWRIILDLESSVQAGQGWESTVEHSVILAASLADRGLRLRRAVGLAANGNELVWMPPDDSPAHRWAILRALALAEPGSTSLGTLLRNMERDIRSHTSIILITLPCQSWAEALLPLMWRCHPHGIADRPGQLRRLGDIRLMMELLNRWVYPLCDHQGYTDRPEARPGQSADGNGAFHRGKVLVRTWGYVLERFVMLIARLFERIGMRNLLLAFLLVGATATVTASLAGLVKGIDERIFWLIGLAGLAAGWLFSRSRLKGPLAALLGFLLGLLLIIYLLAGLGSPLVAMTRSLVSLAVNSLRWKELGPPDNTSLILALQELSTRFNSLVTHLYTWLNGMLIQQPVFDRVALTLIWGLLFWVGTRWAAWSIYRRRQPLAAIFPMAAILAGVLNYTRGNANLLIPIVVVTLSLMGLVSFDSQQRRWVAKQVDYAEDIFMDVSMAVFFLTLLLTTSAAVAPSLSIRQVIRFGQEIYQEFQGDTEQVAESLGISPYERPESLDGIVVEGLPRQHLLKSGPELSEIVVMTIQTNDLPPMAVLEAVLVQLPHYYWRAITFDKYTGLGWESSSTLNYVYEAGEPALEELPPVSGAMRIVNQHVEFAQDLGGLLYATGELITVDQKYKVAWRMPIEQGADPYGVTVQTSSYRAQSLLTSPSIPQLQQAGQEYPADQRSLPAADELPDGCAAGRIDRGPQLPMKSCGYRELWRSFTPWMSQRPPTDRDVADYFLLDLQQGYCDYYATAMVVLARSAVCRRGWQ
jgi:uncharacterized protein (DUF58 family)